MNANFHVGFSGVVQKKAHTFFFLHEKCEQGCSYYMCKIPLHTRTFLNKTDAKRRMADILEFLNFQSLSVTI